MTEKEFIEQLVAIRKSKGISQQRISTGTGIPPVNVRHMEDLSFSPRLDTIIKYVKLLGKNISLKKRKPFLINDSSDFARFIENLSKTISLKEISEKAGCAKVTLANYRENPGKSSLKIFIDIVCVAAGYNIEIVDNVKEEPIMPDQFFKMGGVAKIGKRTICDISSFMSYDGECDRASFNLNGETYEFSNAGKSFKISCFVRK